MTLRVLRNRIARAVFAARLALARRPLASWRAARTPNHGSPALTLVTVAFNNALVIDTQARLLRKWLTYPFRLVVVDNSPDRASRRAIRAVCLANSVEYLGLPRNPYTGRDPSFSHAEALNYTVRHLGGIDSGVAVGFLDHDVFPTAEVSLLEILGSTKAYGRQQTMEDGWYLWPGLMFLRTDSVDIRSLDFSPLRGRGDTGARLSEVLRHWSANDVRFTQSSVGEIEIDGRSEAYELHDAWAHSLSASGWRGAGTERNALVHALRKELDSR